MENIAIFYFSGTGMTEIIINQTKTELEKNNCNVTIFRIDKINIKDVVIDDYNLIGFMYPVHSFNAPRLVEKFIKNLPQVNNKDIFILYTAGEDAKINYSSSNTIIKTLNKKNYITYYNKLIVMPCNFVIKYDDIKVKDILNEAKASIPMIVSDILNKKNVIQKNNLTSNIFSFLGKGEHFGAPMIGKFFYSTNDCIQCNKCIIECPKENIRKHKNKVTFGWSCCICMKCINLCPKNAIKIHQPFKFISFDSWYDNDLFQ